LGALELYTKEQVLEAPQLGAACSLKRRIPLAPSVSLSVLLLGLGAVLSQGQVIIPPPLTQSYTPPALAPGTPAGSSNSLVNILRADQPQTLRSSTVLWPGVVSSSASSTTPETFPGTFISEILLPDLSSYTFKYDSYGNVARIQLPTGGAVEYDWIGQVTSGAGSSPDQFFLRCILTERREYLSGATGTTPSRITKYTTGTAGIAGGVTVSDYDGTGTILQAKTIHNPVAPNWPPLTEAIAYDSPAVGQEPSTQYYDRDGATLLRSISRAYQERSCAGDSTCWWLTNSDLYGRPAHDGLLSHEPIPMERIGRMLFRVPSTLLAVTTLSGRADKPETAISRLDKQLAMVLRSFRAVCKSSPVLPET
jgi:YD repeat-containing protein